MLQNHIGNLLVNKLPTSQPAISNDAEFFPGMAKKWGLTWLINTEDVPGRRSAGSVAWAGLFNTYYWLDPKQQVTGVIMTQILPFADPTVLHLLDEFETAIYRTVKERLSHG
jgi:CubicO group peptidase (beta-lactamase class C family)